MVASEARSVRERAHVASDPAKDQRGSHTDTSKTHLLPAPIIVGGGKRALPDNVLARLDLLDERRFAGGVVHLRYRVRR